MKAMDKYKSISERTCEQLKKRNIDIDGIIEKYVSGMSFDNIKILFKITNEQFDFILDNCITEKMKDKRIVNIGKLRIIASPLPQYKNTKKTSKANKARDIGAARVSFQKAIKAVEGKGEDR